MKRIILGVVGALVLSNAAMAAAYIEVMGQGSDSESDRSTAESNADNQAQNTLNESCAAGTLESSSKTYDSCTQLGDGSWMCMVTYKGSCKIGR